ncbi:MAG TPA: DUF945 family protein [Legionellaceae bacterium]|nr:DUF945 family protein [Legionellaceae bacterium]
MKKWLSIVTVFLVVILSAYYGMGIATERVLKKSLVVLNQSPNITITLHEYQRGWFRSKATLVWTLKIPQQPQITYGPHSLANEKIYDINIPLNIYHGPFQLIHFKPWFGFGYAQSHIILPPIYEQQFRSVTEHNELPQIKLGCFVNYLAQTTVHLDMLGYKLIAKEGDGQFTWRGMRANLQVSANKAQLEGHVLIKGFTWLKNGLKGIHGPIESDFNMHLGVDQLYLGVAHLKMASTALIKNHQPLANFTGVDIESKSDMVDGLYNASLSAKVQQSLLQNRSYGPAEIHIDVTHLDAAVLAKMNQKFSQPTASDLDRQRVILSIIPDISMLLSKGAQFAINHLALSLPEGKVRASLKFNWPNEHIVNPIQFLQKMMGEGKLRVSSAVVSHWMHDYIQQKWVPVPLTNANSSVALPTADPEVQIAQKTTDKMNELIQQGVLTKDGNDYVLVFKFLNGKLFINEHPFSASMLAI